MLNASLKNLKINKQVYLYSYLALTKKIIYMLLLLKAILLFYRGFCLITIMCSLGNAYLVHKEGLAMAFIVVFFTKILTNALVWYFYHTFLEEEFFFYYNLHISKSKLWAGAFIMDTFLMFILFYLS